MTYSNSSKRNLIYFEIIKSTSNYNINIKQSKNKRGREIHILWYEKHTNCRIFISILCCFHEDIRRLYINTSNSAMYKKINLCFVLIAVSIAGNGMAKYLLVDVAEEKRIFDKRAGKLLTEHDFKPSK